MSQDKFNTDNDSENESFQANLRKLDDIIAKNLRKRIIGMKKPALRGSHLTSTLIIIQNLYVAENVVLQGDLIVSNRLTSSLLS